MLQFQPQEHLLHSYIVVSQSEQARDRLALDLTAAMLCRSDGVRPCRACRDCRKVYDGVHPDVIYIAPDRGCQIPVDQGRSDPWCRGHGVHPAERGGKEGLRSASGRYDESQCAECVFEAAGGAASERGVHSCGCKSGAAAADGALTLRIAARSGGAAAGIGRDPGPGRGLSARGCVAKPADAPALVPRARGHGCADAWHFSPPCSTGLSSCWRPGQTLLPEALCAQQLRLIETCEQYRRANVGVKHIFGLLSVSGVQARVQK